jgi:hypothetical protein
MDIFIILRSSRRGNDNLNRDIWGPARSSRAEALEAILEECASMLRSGDDPGENARTEPEIVLDKENSNHNRGMLRFKEPDAGGVTQFDIWDPTSCPDPENDDPCYSDWWERFEIERVSVPFAESVVRKVADTGKKSVPAATADFEYLTDGIRLLQASIKEEVRLEPPVTIHQVLEQEDGTSMTAAAFDVVSVAPGKDGCPVVRGFRKGERKVEGLRLACRYTAQTGYSEDIFWSIGDLLRRLDLWETRI